MKIVVCDRIDEKTIRELKEKYEVLVVENREDIYRMVEDAEVVIVRSATKVDKTFINKGKKLKAIIRAGVGLDNINVKYAEERGIKVRNTPGASTNAVAEQTIGMIIGLMRGLYRGHEEMKKGKWIKRELKGREIKGKILGIIGCGRIGRAVAEKARALGMNVIGYDPHPRENENIEYVELGELYKKSDVISLHTVLIPETENMINRESIEKMKKGVYIINMARGALVDEDALYESIKSGKVAGAGVDVYREEPYRGKLLELKEVFLTPHMGANTFEAQERIGEEIKKIIEEYSGDSRR